jgi:hypothetical protein
MDEAMIRKFEELIGSIWIEKESHKHKREIR